MLKFHKRLRLTTRMSVISQPGITSEPPPRTGRSCCGLLQIPSYSFSGRQVWVSGLSCSIALWLQDSHCHPELETAGLMKIYPFEASGPGQSRRLAGSLAPLRQDCAAEWLELDVQLQAASHVSVGSQLLELLGFGRSWPEFSRSIRKLTVGSLFRKLSRQHKLCASVHSLAPRQLHVLVPDPVLALKLRPSQVVSTTLRNVEGETTPRLQEAFQVRCWHAGLGEDFKLQQCLWEIWVCRCFISLLARYLPLAGVINNTFLGEVYITVPSGIARTASCFLPQLVVSASEERGKK